MSSWQPLRWLGVSGGWGEGERAQWTSVLEPLEDALYWVGRQSQEKHVPGPAPGRSLAIMDRDLFICAAGNFLAAPLTYSTYSLGCSVRSGQACAAQGSAGLSALWPPQGPLCFPGRS